MKVIKLTRRSLIINASVGINTLRGQAMAMGIRVKITVGKLLAGKDRLRDICVSKNDIIFLFRGYIAYTTD